MIHESTRLDQNCTIGTNRQEQISGNVKSVMTGSLRLKSYDNISPSSTPTDIVIIGRAKISQVESKISLSAQFESCANQIFSSLPIIFQCIN